MYVQNLKEWCSWKLVSWGVWITGGKEKYICMETFSDLHLFFHFSKCKQGSLRYSMCLFFDKQQDHIKAAPKLENGKVVSPRVRSFCSAENNSHQSEQFVLSILFFHDIDWNWRIFVLRILGGNYRIS